MDCRLHLAAWAGQTEVVRYLCQHKAEVGAAAMDDMGAIHFAAQKGHLEVVRALVSSGASVKAATRKGMTPLHYAVQGSHVELARYLVRKGGSLSAKSKAGKTPLDLASTEQIRTILLECERQSSSTNADEVVKELNESKDKTENSAADGDGEEQCKPTVEELKEKAGNSAADCDDEEHKDTSIKRKGDEDEGGTTREPKKARVALNHLITTDDNEDDEDM